jgi:hypothetical protein
LLGDAHPERERQLLFDLVREGVGDGEQQLLALDFERYGQVLNGEVRRHPCEHRIGSARQLARGCGWKAHRRREQLREHSLVDPRDLEQIGNQIAAINDLTSERLFDLAHGGDLTLDDQ